MKYSQKALALVALAAQTDAALRFGCSTVTIQRLDPVVEPGNSPSAHLHQVASALPPHMHQIGLCTQSLKRQSCANLPLKLDSKSFYVDT